ncbi:hypothetical protein KP509_05G101400 [Ceratopteris richardii]|nr:hypothetical protein KP509_05G101400 [Ceratopteris richardii]
MAGLASMTSLPSYTVAGLPSSAQPFQSPLLCLPNKRSFGSVSGRPVFSLTGRRSVYDARYVVRATSSSDDTGVSDTSQQLDEFLNDIKAKYDALENKSQVWIYGGGALAALWLSSAVIGAVNRLPLVPKVLELVGLFYTGWFVYRYLLFKSNRRELAEKIQELKFQIGGVPRSAFMTEDDE